MDELSTHDLRGSAFAANLRRAYAAPVADDLPDPFAVLLNRLRDVASDRDAAPLDGRAAAASRNASRVGN